MEPRSWTNYPKTTPEVVKWSGGRRGRGSKKGPAILADPPYDYLSLLRKRRSTTIPPTARRLVVIQITMLPVSPVLGLLLVFVLAFSVFLLSFFSFFAVSSFLFSDFFSFFTSDFLLSVLVSFLTAGVSVLDFVVSFAAGVTVSVLEFLSSGTGSVLPVVFVSSVVSVLAVLSVSSVVSVLADLSGSAFSSALTLLINSTT